MHAADKKQTLKRSLGLTLTTLYGLGTILGAGIYVLVGEIAGLAGIFTPISFLMAFILAAFSAFSYAELSSRFPKSSGEALYVYEGFHLKKLSTLIGTFIALSGIVSSATLIHGFYGYLQVFISSSFFFTTIIILAILTTLAIWGIKESVLAASIITVLEALGLLFIIWVGKDTLSTFPEYVNTLTNTFSIQSFTGIFAGAFVAFYAFIGFEDMVNVAEEVKNPKRTLPLAIIITLIVTFILYTLVSLISILSNSPSELSQSNAPLALVYETQTTLKPTIISLISLCAVINGALIQIIMVSRILYGMANLHWVPSWLGFISKKTHTPIKAILAVTLTILLFALFLPILKLAQLTSFITIFIFMMINLSLLRIKKRTPAPYHAFIIPTLIPFLGALLSLTFLLLQIGSFFIH